MSFFSPSVQEQQTLVGNAREMEIINTRLEEIEVGIGLLFKYFQTILLNFDRIESLILKYSLLHNHYHLKIC